MKDLRLVVVAEDPLARAGLAGLLADQPGLVVLAQSDGRRELVAEAVSAHAEVIVWDLGWNAQDALERLTEVREGLPPIVALLPEEGYAREAWAAGARGLLLRSAPADAIATAAAAVAGGLVALEPALFRRVLPSREPPSWPLEELTRREREVLALLGEGLTNRSIARRLDISEHTVKFHLNSLMAKLGAESRTDAVIRATKLGLLLL